MAGGGQEARQLPGGLPRPRPRPRGAADRDSGGQGRQRQDIWFSHPIVTYNAILGSGVNKMLKVYYVIIALALNVFSLIFVSIECFLWKKAECSDCYACAGSSRGWSDCNKAWPTPTIVVMSSVKPAESTTTTISKPLTPNTLFRIQFSLIDTNAPYFVFIYLLSFCLFIVLSIRCVAGSVLVHSKNSTRGPLQTLVSPTASQYKLGQNS